MSGIIFGGDRRDEMDRNLQKYLNQERCPNCGEAGFDRGETVQTNNGPGWVAIPCTCRNCGYVIEKRRFES